MYASYRGEIRFQYSERAHYRLNFPDEAQQQIQYHARQSDPLAGKEMSQLTEATATAKSIQNGLARLGEKRTVALSVHKSKELIADLEVQIAKLVEQLEAAS